MSGGKHRARPLPSGDLTHAPFRADDNGVLDAHGWSIADVSFYQHRVTRKDGFVLREISTEERTRLMRLLAAAPQMLAALRDIVDTRERGKDGLAFARRLVAAHAAIAAAEDHRYGLADRSVKEIPW